MPDDYTYDEMSYPFDEEDESMIDLGGGMVVPLKELLEDD